MTAPACFVGVTNRTPDGTVTVTLDGHRSDLTWRHALLLASTLLYVSAVAAGRAGVDHDTQQAVLRDALDRGWSMR